MELLSENNVQEVKKTEAELGQEIKEPEQDIKNSIDELKKDYTLSNDSNELNDFIKQKTTSPTINKEPDTGTIADDGTIDLKNLKNDKIDTDKKTEEKTEEKTETVDFTDDDLYFFSDLLTEFIEYIFSLPFRWFGYTYEDSSVEQKEKLSKNYARVLKKWNFRIGVVWMCAVTMFIIYGRKIKEAKPIEKKENKKFSVNLKSHLSNEKKKKQDNSSSDSDSSSEKNTEKKAEEKTDSKKDNTGILDL
jgi:hypothetical protein